MPGYPTNADREDRAGQRTVTLIKGLDFADIYGIRRIEITHVG